MNTKYNFFLGLILSTATLTGSALAGNCNISTNNETLSIAQKKKINSVLVGFRNNISPRQAKALIKKKKSEIIRKISTQNIYQVSTPPGLTVKETVALYKKESIVKFAEANNKSNRR